MIINDGTRKINNKQMCDRMYLCLKALKEGKGAKTPDEKRAMEKQFYKILNGSRNADEVMNYLQQIYDEKDERKALALINDSLIPIFEENDPRLQPQK